MENPPKNGGFNGKIIYKWTIFHLVGGAITILKYLEQYEFVNEKDYPIYIYYMKWKIKFLFESTNQHGWFGTRPEQHQLFLKIS